MGELQDRVVSMFGGVTQGEMASTVKKEVSRQIAKGDFLDIDSSSVSGGEPSKDTMVGRTLTDGDMIRAYKGRAWVNAGVNRVAFSGATMELTLHRVVKVSEGSEDSDTEDVKEHEALDLLDHPNAWESGTYLKYATWIDFLVFGRSYWAMEPIIHPNDKLGSKAPVKSLRRLDPRACKPVGSSKDFITHYEYTVNGKMMPIHPDRVIWFRTYDPDDERGGVGVLQSAADELTLDNYALESNFRYFENDGAPGNVLEQPENSSIPFAEVNRYKEMWKREFRGTKNKSRTAVLPGGWKHHVVNPAIKDMQFGEARKAAKDAILAVIGTPPALLGEVDSANRANMDAQERYFWQITMEPHLRNFVETLNRFYLPRFEDKLEFRYDLTAKIPEDLKMQSDIDKAYVDMGAITKEEVREWRFGLDPIEVEEEEPEDDTDPDADPEGDGEAAPSAPGTPSGKVDAAAIESTISEVEAALKKSDDDEVDVEKFNQNHGAGGKFASGGAGGSSSITSAMNANPVLGENTWNTARESVRTQVRGMVESGNRDGLKKLHDSATSMLPPLKRQVEDTRSHVGRVIPSGKNQAKRSFAAARESLKTEQFKVKAAKAGMKILDASSKEK